jgi:hypothetical protein
VPGTAGLCRGPATGRETQGNEQVGYNDEPEAVKLLFVDGLVPLRLRRSRAIPLLLWCATCWTTAVQADFSTTCWAVAGNVGLFYNVGLFAISCGQGLQPPYSRSEAVSIQRTYAESPAGARLLRAGKAVSWVCNKPTW